MGSGFNLFKNWVDVSPTEVERWVPISVAGLVPAEATGVILRLANRWYRSIAAVRRTGDPDDFSQYCQLLNRGHTHAFVGLDSNLAFEAYCKNDAFASYEGNPIKIYLCGYTDESVVFLENGFKLPQFAPKKWNPCDLSPYISPDTTGAIFLVFNTHPTTGRGFSIRGFGSTDEHWGSDYGIHATHLALGSEASNFCYALVAVIEGKIESLDNYSGGELRRYLIGYTKAPVTFLRNSMLKTMTDRSAWREIAVPEIPAGADSVIVEMRNIAPGGKQLSIRKCGSTNNDREYSRLGIETAFWGICGLEEGKFEAYAGWADKAQFFIHGYTQPIEAGEYVCMYCGAVFPSQAEMDAHVLADHTFICEYCDEVFHSQEDLDKHLEEEHGIFDYPIYEIAVNILVNELAELGLEEMVKPQFRPDAIIRYTDRESWAKMVPFLTFSAEYYVKYGCDCDDYRKRASAEAAFRFQLNGCLEVRGGTPLGLHGWNIVYTGGATFAMFEPNAGFWYAGELFDAGDYDYQPEAWR